MSLPLFTIGHSNHPIETFLELIQSQGISVVCDVRSQPFSRYNPQYNREGLERTLVSCGIRYAFMGRRLGARPEDPRCYHEGKVMYDRLAESLLFLEGLGRLRKGMETERVALMCAEKDPLECHRSILICRRLRTPGINIAHILDSGELEDHMQTEQRLLTILGLQYPSLFDSSEELIERAYNIQGEKIAYSETTDAASIAAPPETSS